MSDVVEVILSQLNASRLFRMEAEALLSCLKSERACPVWKGHVEGFFRETPIATIHDLLLSGRIDIADLHRAVSVWGIKAGRARQWVEKYHGFKMGKTA